MQANIKRFIVALTTSGLLFSPAFAIAVEGSTPTTKTRTAQVDSSKTGFCARAANVRTELNTKIAELDKQRTDKKTEITENLKERKDERTQKVKEQREEVEQKFEEALDDIEDELTTAQKAALATFKATVKRAQATRKAAVDAAHNKYRTDLATMVNRRQEAIRAAAATLKSSVAAANAKAAADCAAGVEPDTVRLNLRNTIGAAQAKYKTDVQAVETIGSQIRELITVRNTAIQAARDAFRTTVNQAKETLKAALGTTTTPPPSPTPTTP